MRACTVHGGYVKNTKLMIDGASVGVSLSL